MKTTMKIKLHICSPVHIGCGDAYDPTQFVIDGSKGILKTFKTQNFLELLSAEKLKTFTKICKNESILSLYKFIHDNCPKDIEGREIAIARGLAEHYNRIMKLGTYNREQIINQFTLARTIYNPHTGLPYIPGSSLKGAIKTAWLSYYANEKQIRGYHGRSDRLETELLGGSFGKDPFRFVSISDLLPANKNLKTKVLYATNLSKNKEKLDRGTNASKGPYQIFETLTKNSVFEGKMNLVDNTDVIKKAGHKYSLTSELVVKALNKHFISKLEDERALLKNLGIDFPIISNINIQFKGKFGKTALLLRLGHHSGAEAVTIDNNRNIKIMCGRRPAQYKSYATTVWLASNEKTPNNLKSLAPFGWAVLEFV